MPIALSPLELVYCTFILLLAYGLRGSTGFGGALGMPLLALVIPIKTLVPVWTLLGIASSITIVGHERRHVDMRAVVPFLPWCLLGIGLGLYVFATLDAATLARALGALVIAYAAYSLWGMMRKRAVERSQSRVVAPLASALSGVVGATFGTMATVFFVMYLDTRSLPKEAFRATMSAMLLVLSVVRGIGYFAVGEFTRESWVLFAAALPAMIIGIYIGNRIHLAISETTFRRLVIFTLFVCGIPLLLR
jgi:uncharacterized membrane protein YfcA